MNQDRLFLNVEAINRARIERGLSKADFMRKYRFGPVTCASIFRGGPVSVRTANKVAAALGLPYRRVVNVSAACASPAAEHAA